LRKSAGSEEHLPMESWLPYKTDTGEFANKNRQNLQVKNY
jgi:hypothetical protein